MAKRFVVGVDRGDVLDVVEMRVAEFDIDVAVICHR